MSTSTSSFCKMFSDCIFDVHDRELLLLPLHSSKSAHAKICWRLWWCIGYGRCWSRRWQNLVKGRLVGWLIWWTWICFCLERRWSSLKTDKWPGVSANGQKSTSAKRLKRISLRTQTTWFDFDDDVHTIAIRVENCEIRWMELTMAVNKTAIYKDREYSVQKTLIW